MNAPAAEILRCKRCGTILRGGRTACPSCGTEVGATSESPVPKSTAPRKGGWAQATESASLCPMCMATVSAEDLREYEDQKICTNCYELMSAKKMRSGPSPQ